MHRQLLAMLLLFSFAVQVFSRPIFVLGYYFNTASFAKACENKALPKLHCNGKCQLMKKLQQQEKKEQQEGEKKSENKADVLSSQSFFISGIAAPETIYPACYYCKEKKPRDYSSFVFRPPLS